MNDKKVLGKIEVVCGPMFAGKTEELIRRIKRLEYAKKPYIVFTNKIDTRYSDAYIVSHSNSRIKATFIGKAKEIYNHIKSDIKVIVIDEAQFFDKEIVSVAEDLANKGYRVIIGGLDRNFRGEPFGYMGDLLAISDEITKLTAICPVCGRDAIKTQRFVNGKIAKLSDPLVLIGEKESYEPRCRNCYKKSK